VRALLWRPWLVAAGVSFGLACGTKWDAVYPLAAFGVLTFVWSAGARRSVGVRWSLLRAALVDGVPAFLQLVLVALVVYVASWTGWLIHHHQYEEYLSSNTYRQFVSMQGCDSTGNPIVTSDETRKWPTADEHASGPAEVVDALRSLWYYHQDVYVFHTHFLNCATHPYASKPSGWPLLNRPVGVATDLTVKPGTEGCTAAADQVCYREVLLIGTPVLWWGGALALIAAGVLWIGTRDWRWGVTIVGALSTWLPWLQYAQRPIFSFYAISYLPFAVLALAMVMGKLIGRDRTPTARRTVGVVVAGSFFVLVLVNFAYFYPILSYQVLPRPDWVDRMWFARWI
jgi:dolichyl-phosphate-mannose--protein O-mannosyl transferase